jgi:plastocyanin
MLSRWRGWPESEKPAGWITSGVLPLAIAAGCGGGPRHHHAEIRDLVYQPAALRVAVGDTVTWDNRDIVPHTVTLEPGGSPDEVAPGAAITVVITEAGAQRYWCRYHPLMTATIEAR